MVGAIAATMSSSVMVATGSIFHVAHEGQAHELGGSRPVCVAGLALIAAALAILAQLGLVNQVVRVK